MARPKKSSVLDFRILFLAVFILASLFAIGLRLWFVQVKMADYYRGRIQGSSEVTVRIPSIRGEIRDRNGVPLVTNRPSYEVDFYLPDLVSGYRKLTGFTRWGASRVSISSRSRSASRTSPNSSCSR